jgi:hypothetical protein
MVCFDNWESQFIFSWQVIFSVIWVWSKGNGQMLQSGLQGGQQAGNTTVKADQLNLPSGI